MTDQPDKTDLAKLKRRWLRFSVRTLLIVTALVAVWLGVLANRVHKQRAAVAAIEAAGGTVYYDWQGMPRELAERERVPFEVISHPRWLVRLYGRENLQDVVHVSLGDAPVDGELVGHLRSLQELQTLDLPAGVDARLIKAELPGVRVIQ